MQNRSQEAANTICPVCGAPVDARIQVVIVPHASDDEDGDAILRIGTCCEGCRAMVLADPDPYFTVAMRNGIAVGG